MRTHTVLLAFLVCAVAVLAANGAHADIRSGLVGYYPLDEGTGTVAHDMSGYGHDGTLNNGITWIMPGYQGGGVNDNGAADARIQLGTWNPAEGTGQLSLAMWIRWAGGGGTYQGLLGKRDTWPGTTMFQLQVRPENGGTFRLETGSYAIVSPNNTLNPLVHTWVHVAATFDGTTARLYLNGQQVASGTFAFTMAGTGSLMGIGSVTGGGAGYDGNNQTFLGDMDEVAIFNQALSADEVTLVMAGLGGDKASNPQPADRSPDVPRDVVVGWDPVKTAATRDVYFGMAFADVNQASRAGPGTVLVSRGQTDTTFTPADLDYDRTYYWRIDEVNGTPDATIFRGDVWSFTTEPYAYPITNLTAQASSHQAAWPATKTIDGSGLDALDQHSNDMNTMWMSMGIPAWIQYTFDREYKLGKLWVWNANSPMEGFMGFGAKDVRIEYSVDGAVWTELAGVPVFAQALGLPTYTADTVVDFGGVAAKYVRLSIDTTWGNPMSTSLSEVRFFYVPVQARAPEPADGATNVGVDTDLTWRPGREADSHQVFFGTDPEAVAQAAAAARTVAGHSFTPAALQYGTTYSWRVDELNATTYPGNVWRFTTQEYATWEDFESYNDTDNCIYDAWIDGVTDGLSGSMVGYNDSAQGTFGERTIVHSGSQSMPLQYDNTAAPYYSEAQREFAIVQDWTEHGANALRLYLRGNACGFQETAAGEIIMNGTGTDIWDTSDKFRYVYKNLNGDGSITARVVTMVRTDGWAKAGVMIRESTHPGSKHAFVCLTPDYGVSFQQRPETGNVMSQVSTNTVVSSVWVKLTRTGNAFTAQHSADGVNWTNIAFPAPVNISMAADVCIGLAVTSHNAAAVTAAEFSNLSTTGSVTGSWQVASIGVDQPAGNSAEPMYVRIKDSSGAGATVRSADAIVTVRATWRQWTIPYSELAGVNLSRVKSMCIGVGSPSTPTAGGTGTVYIDDIALGRPLAR